MKVAGTISGREGASSHAALVWRRWVNAPILFCALATQSVAAQDVDTIGRAFADNCFSPYLTAQKAQDRLARSGVRVDFYDLRPFSSAAPSPVTGRAATPGTDRRCEVAFDGDKATEAQEWLVTGLKQEGLDKRAADVPAGFPQQPGLQMIAAAQLNPNRIAVVQVGVRPGANGPETFMSVERLDPLDGS